jgi:hypothetical protein
VQSNILYVSDMQLTKSSVASITFPKKRTVCWTWRPASIYGLGGCGKSALALEFAYRASVRYARHMVFWVPAISQESFELAYHEIGVRLGVPGITEDNADIRKLVKEALSSGSLGDWLMIVDNADDSGVLLGTTDNNPMSARLSDCLPHSNRGTILFTTRSRKVAGELTPSSVLELNDMSKAEARQLLARRLTKQGLLDDEEIAGETHISAACYCASSRFY